jgi:IS30 family transposase
MKEKTYTRLSLKERTQIESYLILSKSITEIALLLNRPKSTISREISRGLAHPGSSYNAEQSNWHSIFYKKTRRIDSKISLNNSLRFYIIRRLKMGWSPEQIANRVRCDYPDDHRMRISHESIYKYIYCETKGRLQKRLIALLPYNKPKRIGGSNTKIYMGTIIGRTSIDERPKSIEYRTEEGHWEGDFIVGKDQKSVIGTLVDILDHVDPPCRLAKSY